jgi:hypothetical protein
MLVLSFNSYFMQQKTGTWPFNGPFYCKSKTTKMSIKRKAQGTSGPEPSTKFRRVDSDTCMFLPHALAIQSDRFFTAPLPDGLQSPVEG